MIYRDDPEDDIPQPCYLPDDGVPLEVEWHLPAYWWTSQDGRQGDRERQTAGEPARDDSRRAVAADVFSQQGRPDDRIIVSLDGLFSGFSRNFLDTKWRKWCDFVPVRNHFADTISGYLVHEFDTTGPTRRVSCQQIRFAASMGSPSRTDLASKPSGLTGGSDRRSCRCHRFRRSWRARAVRRKWNAWYRCMLVAAPMD